MWGHLFAYENINNIFNLKLLKIFVSKNAAITLFSIFTSYL